MFVTGNWEAIDLIFLCRYAPSTTGRRVILDMPGDQFLESGHIHYNERADSFSYSNFVDLDWLSSSGNSCEEEPYER